jgi:hypothetical protein
MSHPTGAEKKGGTQTKDHWFKSAFNDLAWKTGPGGFGNKGTPNGVDRTPWHTSAIWLRRAIVLPDRPFTHLQLQIHADDYADVYLNGVLAAQVTKCTPDYVVVPMSEDARKSLRPGTNVLAVTCRDSGGGRYIDVGLVELKKRAAFHDVQHLPLQPKPDIPVLVTARMPAGTTKATLQLQAVAPGKYVRKSDPSYLKDWTDLPMRDDGREGDAKAGDGIFSVRVPATWQRHRWLVRYCIVSIDKEGQPTQTPPADEPSPNFAWWCDAGPSPWAGTRDPGKTPVLSFSSEFLGTMQTMHLVAKADDVARSQWDGAFHRKKLPGTIVYRGVVHDHIQFSNRGRGSANIAGKNKWGLKFNDRSLLFHDHDGVRWPDSIRSLNLNPGGSTPYLPVFRGITGLDEVLSLRAYRLVGVPSPPGHVGPVARRAGRRRIRSQEPVQDRPLGPLCGHRRDGPLYPCRCEAARRPDRQHAKRHQAHPARHDRRAEGMGEVPERDAFQPQGRLVAQEP